MKSVVASLFVAATFIASEAQAEEAPVVLEMTRGSVVRHGRDATVTVRVRNTTASAVTLYLRRDLMTFDVVGPGGDETTCPPIDWRRHPARLGFTTLRPHRSLVMTARLVELCPRWTFSKHGDYVVSVRYQTLATGQGVGLHAFTGQLDAERPVVVRVEHDARVFRNHVVERASRPMAAAPAPLAPRKARAVPVHR